ncbi:MAG: transpeptidase family protein [Acidobacteriales bacterium]|nr:transpeptidase family protein [Terriglobales bacterium]
MTPNQSRNSKTSRVSYVAVILLLWCAAICARLVYLQIFSYGTFALKARHQQQRTEAVSAQRGVIYDRAGHELAMSVSVDSVFAIPSEIHDLPVTTALLARITKADPRELFSRCNASPNFCWIARKGDAGIADRVRALHLRGVYFQKEPKRFYPKGELGAQVLGYVGMDDAGLGGIEHQYDEKLHGVDGRVIVSVDARRRWFGSVEKQPSPGENVVLTIDEKVQYIAEHELDAAMRETHAETGTIVVENPHTGEILALANRPTFNPNLSREVAPQSLKNHAVSDVYEPGSTFKLVTIAAALEEKLTRPDEVFDCQMGSIVINGMRIRDHKAYGLLPVTKILANSSDVGAIKIALRLGEDRFYKYIRAFGFGQPTGIELPGETRGLAKPVSRWSKVSIGAIAMGQEIGITPIQLAGLVSTIANDGVWVAPRIVAATTEPQTTPRTVVFHPAAERRVLSTMTAAEVKQMMQDVVLEGTGRKAILEGYSSAGKTGTAQKVDPATRAYSRTKYVASFAGFAPINNPAITVAVILDSPAGLHQGGQVSAPVFQRVSQQVLEYLHVAHDVDLPQNRQVLMTRRETKQDDLAENSPDHLGASLEVAEDASPTPVAAPVNLAHQTAGATMGSDLPGLGVTPASLRQSTAAPGPILQPSSSLPSPPTHAALASDGGATVVLDAGGGGILVPSFIGKSLRQAIETAEGSGLDLEAAGNGLAQGQQPPPGSHVPAGSKVMVHFGR